MEQLIDMINVATGSIPDACMIEVYADSSLNISSESALVSALIYQDIDQADQDPDDLLNCKIYVGNYMHYIQRNIIDSGDHSTTISIWFK